MTICIVITEINKNYYEGHIIWTEIYLMGTKQPEERLCLKRFINNFQFNCETNTIFLNLIVKQLPLVNCLGKHVITLFYLIEE